MIKTVGVAGAGAMGTGIAQVAAMAGCDVRLFDQRNNAAQQALGRTSKVLNALVEKGKTSPEQSESALARLTAIENTDGFSGCDLVIEAITEQAVAKRTLFASIEEIVDSHCVLATNTSSLSVASIGAGCIHPGRVIGLHFFNPAPVMPLVEIVPALTTSTELPYQLKEVMHLWGKKPVIAKDTPGFIVNRIARPYYGEALRIFEEGLATPAQIDEVMCRLGGFKMGPFELMDFIGHDVNYAVTESVYSSFYYDPRYRPSISQKRLVEAGWLGRKSERGFFNYQNGGTSLKEAIPERQGRAIFYRILAMLINEAADALYLGVATREDLDMAMKLGVGYPKGLLEWADEMGTDIILNHLEDLMEEYSEDRYRPSPLLRKMGLKNKKFYN